MSKFYAYLLVDHTTTDKHGQTWHYSQVVKAEARRSTSNKWEVYYNGAWHPIIDRMITGQVIVQEIKEVTETTILNVGDYL